MTFFDGEIHCKSRGYPIYYEYKRNNILQPTGGDTMLKLEIKFNDAQMRAEHKYAPEAIYAALDKSFA